MEKKTLPFFGIPQAKIRDRSLRQKQTAFSDLFSRDESVRLLNAEIAHPYMRTHRKIGSLQLGDPVDRILGVRVCGGKAIVFALQHRYLAIYVYANGSFDKCYASVTQYEADMDLEDFARDVLYTDDADPDLPIGANDPKMLIFPAGKYMVLEDGCPVTMADLPHKVLRFEHAAISGGRVYGTVGQHLYISSARGCFDWTYDLGGDVDPKNAYDTAIASYTDRQTPVHALISYKGNVYIFRENAIQRITGSSNPFSVKEALQVGTKYASSIRELNGALYFINDRTLFCFNGHSLEKVPPIPEGYVPNGAACVFGGKYWFTATKNGYDYLMHYDPEAKGYGSLYTEAHYTELAACGGEMLLLGVQNGASVVARLTDARSNVDFMLDFPLFDDDLGPKSLTEAALRCRLGSGAEISVGFDCKNDDGTTCAYSTAAAEGHGRDAVLRLHGKLPAAAFIRVHIAGTGDITVKSLEAVCRRARQKKTK